MFGDSPFAYPLAKHSAHSVWVCVKVCGYIRQGGAASLG